MIIGIDPGKTGAIACVDGTNSSLSTFEGLTEQDIYRLITSYCLDAKKAYIELVHSMPGQGVKSMFTFGQNLGFLRCSLIANGVPFEEVLPSRWQQVFGMGKRYPSPNERKKAHHAKAQQLFPSLNIKKSAADALLIAEYGRRITGDEREERGRR